MTRRVLPVLLVLASVAGCGVSAEDEPRRIDDTLIRRPATTPTASTHPVTTTATTTTTAATTTATSVPPAPGHG